MDSDAAQSKQLKSFGQNVRRLRVARSLTQEALAERAELNIRTVQKIEAGELNILLTTLHRIQTALGCKDWRELLG